MTNTAERRAYNRKIREAQKEHGVRRVSVTMSAAEYTKLLESAERHGDRPTTHLKRCAFSYSDDAYLVPPDTANKLSELVAILRSVGNNLNQLARHSNEMRYFLDTSEVRLQIRRLEDEVRAFVATPPKV